MFCHFSSFYIKNARLGPARNGLGNVSGSSSVGNGSHFESGVDGESDFGNDNDSRSPSSGHRRIVSPHHPDPGTGASDGGNQGGEDNGARRLRKKFCLEWSLFEAF